MILTADKVRDMMPSREIIATTFVNDCMGLITETARRGRSSASITMDGESKAFVEDIAKVFELNGYSVQRCELNNTIVAIVVDWSV